MARACCSPPKRQALGDQEHAMSKSSPSQLDYRKDITMKTKTNTKAGDGVDINADRG